MNQIMIPIENSTWNFEDEKQKENLSIKCIFVRFYFRQNRFKSIGFSFF